METALQRASFDLTEARLGSDPLVAGASMRRESDAEGGLENEKTRENTANKRSRLRKMASAHLVNRALDQTQTLAERTLPIQPVAPRGTPRKKSVFFGPEKVDEPKQISGVATRNSLDLDAKPRNSLNLDATPSESATTTTRSAAPRNLDEIGRAASKISGMGRAQMILESNKKDGKKQDRLSACNSRPSTRMSRASTTESDAPAGSKVRRDVVGI